ncbi:MAG: FecR domain-containing protein, partial [Rhizobiaceae bacterium]|nr:FecR domain-containing protein [Rhizobiaceae bacterium]
NATVADADALKRWRAASDRHEQAFREAAQAWQRLGPALGARQIAPRAIMTRRRLLTAGGLAAGSAGVALGLSQIGILPLLDTWFADYATGIGEQRTVRLPDGSMATLDGGTALSIHFSQTDRAATLSSGAAVFDVAADAQRPFRLNAANGETASFDASFSAALGSDDVSIECLRGNVKVDCRGSDDLAEGEAVSYSSDGLGEKSKADVETSAAWRKGLLIFRNRTVADVVSDLNRHRKGKVIIASRSLRSQRVSGVFHLDRPEEILSHLETTMQTRPVALPGGIVLLM